MSEGAVAAKVETKGNIFNIQRMSIHDGPGIRTVVFLKGCPMRCVWCSNPESQSFEPEISFMHNRCIQCGYCKEVCPEGLISDDGTFRITDRASCTLCMECVKECCVNAKKVVGEYYTVDGIVEEILKDKQFYDESGGGVTFSGGEPFAQGAFLLEVLKKCKENGLHTAVESCGMGESDVICDCLPYLDLVFFDLKQMDDRRHRELTGVSNEKILENLKLVSDHQKNVIVRVPVIPGLNDSEENIAKTAEYVSSLSLPMLQFLPYHDLGKVKYVELDREYQLSDLKAPSDEAMKHLVHVAEQQIGSGQTKVSIEKSI